MSCTLVAAHVCGPPAVAVEPQVRAVHSAAACECLDREHAACQHAVGAVPALHPRWPASCSVSALAHRQHLRVALEVVPRARPPVDQHHRRPRLAKHIIRLRYRVSQMNPRARRGVRSHHMNARNIIHAPHQLHAVGRPDELRLISQHARCSGQVWRRWAQGPRWLRCQLVSALRAALLHRFSAQLLVDMQHPGQAHAQAIQCACKVSPANLRI
jgi:hypothetical protein